MILAQTCPECGRQMPPDAPDGLCPACLLGFGAAELGISRKAQDTERGVDKGGSLAPGGQRFGDYELLEELGRGGMGVVYKARQVSLNRIVAIKLLPFGEFRGYGALDRFRAEAIAPAGLQHPNIVAIHEIGEQEGQHYFSMDYIAGRTLADVVQEQGPLAAARAAAYVEALATAVHYAHQRGVLHRDLKPANIILDEQDQPRITDFGLAKRLSDPPPSSADPQLTLSGQVLGSPSYLPPEQADPKHGPPGPTSDVYGLGAILYHLVTGRPPFQADSLTTLLREVIETEPVPPRSLNASTPKDLETICLRCLEKQPSRRYATAQALADDVGRFLRGEPVHARPVGAVGKAWRWCRRQPVRASLVGALTLAVVIGITGISWEWRQAEEQRRRAIGSASRLQREVYAADMNLVQRSLQDADLRAALRLLDKYRPRSITDNSGVSRPKQNAEVDLRGWEWRYLWGLSRSDDQGVLAQYPEGDCILALAPGSDLLAVCRGDGLIHLWDLPTHQTAGTLTNGLMALAFSDDGRRIASAGDLSNDKATISVWDVDQRRILWNLPQPSAVVALALSPDGKRVAVFNTDPWLRVWDVESGDLTLELPASHFLNGTGRVPLFSPDGNLLASGETEGQVRLIDLTTRQIREIPAPPGGNCMGALAFSPDGRLLATGHAPADGRIRLWEVATGALENSLEGHLAGVNKLVFAPDGRSLYSASEDQTIRVWDLTGREPCICLKGHTGPINGLGLSRDGQTLVSSSSDGSVRLWDTNRPRRPGRHAVLPEPAGTFGAVFTADSRRVVTASCSKPVTIWDVATGTILERISELGTNNLCLSLSPDQHLLAVGGTNGVLQVWDMEAKVLVKQWQPHRLPVYSVAFLDGGKSLLSIALLFHQRAEFKRWGAVSWEELPFSGWETAPLYGCGFSADRCFLALPGAKGLRIWNCAADLEQMVLAGVGGISAFSFDGRLIAASDSLGTGVWEMSSGRRVGGLEALHRDVSSLAFSPDGKRLVTGFNVGGQSLPGLCVWDFQVGRDLLSLYTEGTYISLAQFSPDGNTLLAVTWYGAVNLYRAPSWAEIEAKEKTEAGL